MNYNFYFLLKFVPFNSIKKSFQSQIKSCRGILDNYDKKNKKKKNRYVISFSILFRNIYYGNDSSRWNFNKSRHLWPWPERAHPLQTLTNVDFYYRDNIKEHDSLYRLNNSRSTPSYRAFRSYAISFIAFRYVLDHVATNQFETYPRLSSSRNNNISHSCSSKRLPIYSI